MGADPHITHAEPRRSRCLYRRAGRHWWRVDADITGSGALMITSGDANEWQVIVGAGSVPTLLRALRRDGDLMASIGGDADDELLERLVVRFGPHEARALDELKDYLATVDVPFETRFWSGDAPSEEAHEAQHDLSALLHDALEMVTRDGADFTWSSWQDRDAARSELLDFSLRVATQPREVVASLAVIFAPSGPMAELALSSGWSTDYLALGARFDALQRDSS